MLQNHDGTCDLCIIGCGAAGFAAAMRALDFGKQVCIVESGEIGGAAVKWGALASKTLWELSKDFAIASKKDRGYRASDMTLDYPTVRSTVLQAVKEKQNQMRAQIEAFSRPRWKGPGAVACKKGLGSFTDQKRLRIPGADGRNVEIDAKNYLIAPGSMPRRLPGIDVDQKRVLDSDGILRLKSFPDRLMIIGAGIVGCEYATIFSNFKQTHVLLVDHMDRILPYEDPDISRFVQTNLEKNGVEIFHSATLKEIRRKNGINETVEVTLEFEPGAYKIFETDAVLLSIGREPNLSRLNLDVLSLLSLKPEPGEGLRSDYHCLLGDNVYCAGGVSAHPDLVNVAEMEGRHAVEHMFGAAKNPINYRNMSTVMFFYPAVAAVGLNENTCRRKRIPHRVAYYSNALVPRAIAMRAVNGFVKILVHDDDQMILGMRAAGPQVSNTIMSISYLIDQQKGLTDVLRSLHPHPTLSEGIQECLRVLQGASIYKPHVFPEHIQVRTWDPDSSSEDVDGAAPF